MRDRASAAVGGLISSAAIGVGPASEVAQDNGEVGALHLCTEGKDGQKDCLNYLIAQGQNHYPHYP